MPEISLYEGVSDLISELLHRNIKVGIITDGRVSGQKKKIQALGLDKLVNDIIITDQNALEFLSSHVTFLSTYEGYAEISTRGQNRDLYVHIIEWVIIYFLQKHMEEDKAVDTKYNFGRSNEFAVVRSW